MIKSIIELLWRLKSVTLNLKFKGFDKSNPYKIFIELETWNLDI